MPDPKKPAPTITKPSVTIAGVPLSANGAIAWKFQTGVQPYTAVFSCYKHDWDTRLKQKVGEDVDLIVSNGSGSTQTVRELTILHTVASDSPNRVSFLVADRRWKWSYKMIVRDYNIPRKTGDRVANNGVRPIENQVVVDQYDFRPHSLKEDGKRWEAEDVIRDILEQLDGDSEKKGKGKAGPTSGGKGGLLKNSGYRWVIEKFPIRPNLTQDGAYSIQNIVLRDQGDAALARALSFMPGADVYVDTDGFTRLFDSTDLERMEQYFKDLPPATWDGDRASFIDRNAIRPSEDRVHYQREVEVVFDYSDDYTSNTSADPIRNSPFLENVIPTVDPVTTILGEWDSETNTRTTKKVPPGTWVTVKTWLEAMDAVKPEGSPAWTFDNFAMLWLAGDMEGAFSGALLRGSAKKETGSVSQRINAFRQHFRQTFRISRRFTERVRDIRNVRVGVLDPVTGARAPAAVWGQATVIPTVKGKHFTARRDKEAAAVFRQIDNLPTGGQHINDAVPSPARIVVKDVDLGIFSVQWVMDPYGLAQAYIPSHLKGPQNQDAQVWRDLSQQGKVPMSPGAIQHGRGGTDSIFLAPKMEMKVMLTIVPSAPNNKTQMHVVTVKAKDIKDVFRTEFRIQDGKGPVLNVFIPPGEITARFAWEDDVVAPQTLERLLGLNTDDPTKAGLVDDPETKDADESQMLGYQIANQGREINGHSKAVAAEMLSAYADNLHGTVVTALPHRALFLRGNMAGATIQVAAAPSAKVSVVHTFPGQSRTIPRLALMPDASRRLIMGILPFGTAD